METKQLSTNNATFVEALKKATAAVFHLDDIGCTVLSIDVQTGTPVLVIAQPPLWAPLVAHQRTSTGEPGGRRVTYRAEVMGARVEWAGTALTYMAVPA